MRVLTFLFLFSLLISPARAGKLDLDLVAPFRPRGLAPARAAPAAWGPFRLEHGASKNQSPAPIAETVAWTGQTSLAVAGLLASLGGPPGVIAGFGAVILFQAARGIRRWLSPHRRERP